MAASEAPMVSLSFANNFWGKEDAGVGPLLDRMHSAKVTSEELKDFYHARAQIEEDYSKKLLNLARKPLGSTESGTLRMSMDVVRGEVETMGKSHQVIAGQLKQELEEPLVAFAGGLKERRKIIQSGIEKLLQTKNKQTHAVNKARDRYEQDCLKIKGYLAQGHMVMGQEERKNKAKLEKTQVQMSATSQEYEQAVKFLEETTGRWNREWKAACDKFQDLEEERLDFTKSSLWSFANIASTACVSDDASCEKIRLSLEDCDVEKDITGFIKEQGTGQEIPDPPKYINFCRGDLSDNVSEASDDGAYSVAQFARAMNPAFRSSSPQPSTYSSHHDTSSNLANSMGLSGRSSMGSERQPSGSPGIMAGEAQRRPSLAQKSLNPYADIPTVPHNAYPMDGMTQFCRLDPPSDRSSIPSPTRPDSREDSHSDYSNPTSFSSFEPSSGHSSPTKQFNGSAISSASEGPMQSMPALKEKKSGFFQNRSPFGRKSKHEKESPMSPMVSTITPTQRNTWAAPSRPVASTSPTRPFAREPKNISFGGNRPSPSPEPELADPRARFELNIGNNVFDVASPDKRRRSEPEKDVPEDFDPIAKVLEELKGVTKQSSTRISADRYHGLSTPVPTGSPNPAGRASPLPFSSDYRAAQRGTPPPSYDPPVSRLGAPQPAFTSKQMQQTTANYVSQNREMFSAGQSGGRSGARSAAASRPIPRSTSPAPLRSTSPRPYSTGRPPSQQQPYRATSPNPYSAPQGGRPRAQSSSPIKPQVRYGEQQTASQGSNRPPSSRGGEQHAAMVLRPTSQYYGSEGGWAAAASTTGSPAGGAGAVSTRVRSQSSAGQMPVTKDGRPILNYSRAVYMYQAAIPEELSFAKGDVLAVLRLQDDGWWEAEIVKQPGKRGLVPSNYLVAV